MDLEYELNPRVAVPDFQRDLDEDSRRSVQARRSLHGVIDIRYGPGALQTLDVFPSATSGAPTHVFIHGGYWRALDKSLYSFVASTLVDAGATVVIPNYDLCPAVTLDEIVSQIGQCFAWVVEHIAHFNGRPDAVTISGHSAGAHLAAMLLSERAEGIKGACLISGVYDLRPVLDISVNADLRLDEAMAARNSPILSPPSGGCDVQVLVGARETTSWKKQSYEFWRACVKKGNPAHYIEVDDEDHFSITGGLDRESHPVTHTILKQITDSR